MCHEYACDVAASRRGELHCTVSHRRSVPRSRGSPCEPLTPGGKVRLTRIWIAFIDSVPEKKIEIVDDLPRCGPVILCTRLVLVSSAS
jgi:hypothetical protein